MAIAMVAMLAFGGTYAYFTATATQQKATVQTGSVKLTATLMGATAEYSATKVLPGDAISTNALKVTPAVEENNDKGAYIAVRFTVSIKGSDNAEITTGDNYNAIINAISIGSETDNWVLVENGVYVYVDATNKDKTGKTTVAKQSVSGTAVTVFDVLTLPESVTDDYLEANVASGNSTNKFMNATITITVDARVIQGAHFGATDDAATIGEVGNALFPTEVTSAT